MSTTTVDNKALTQRFFDALNEHDLDKVGDLLHPEVVMHAPAQEEPLRGREEVLDFLKQVYAGLPDFKASVETMIAEDDLVAVRFRTSGRQDGNYFGIPPTGRAVGTHEIEIIRVVDGQAVEVWQELNILGVMQKLGVIPKKPLPKPILWTMVKLGRLGRRS